MNHILFFGYGYVADNLSRSLAGFKTTGTKRTTESGLVKFDDFAEIESDTTHILISIPPIGEEDIVYSKFNQQIKKLKNIKWIGYLSSTGVYGDHKGNWVDEYSSVIPTNERSQNRLNSEYKWLSLFEQYNVPIVIFRLSGIYGIGRNPLERLIKGENIDLIEAHNIYFSRIHIYDIVNVLKSSMDNITPNEIYNIADDYPCENFRIIQYAYDILGKIPSNFKDLNNANLSPMMKEFYSDNKKISNQKIKQTFKINLKYPTYKEGLKSIKKYLDNQL